MTKDLNLIHRVTANYFFWQGLRLVPFGFYLLIIALQLAAPSWWPFNAEPLNDAVPWIALLIAFVAFKVIGDYYGRNFGHVQAKPGMHFRRNQIKWLIAYPAMILSLIVDLVLKPPVFISGVIWGLAILGYWWSTGKGRNHYLAAAVLLVTLTLLPLAGLMENGKPTVTLIMAILGVIYIIGGILDHLEFASVMRTGTEEQGDANPI